MRERESQLWVVGANMEIATSVLQMACCQSSWIIRLIVVFIQKRLQGSNDDVNMDNVHRVESYLMWLKQFEELGF
jgi:hypothetical protein